MNAIIVDVEEGNMVQYAVNAYGCDVIGRNLDLYVGVVLNTELLGRSEHQSMSDVDVRGAEFSGSDVLQRNLKIGRAHV